MRISSKLTIVLLELSCIPLLLMGFVAYFNVKNEITRQVLSKLEAVADIQKSRVENSNKDNLEQLILFTNDREIRRNTSAFINSRSVESQESLNQIMRDAIGGISNFREMFIVNLEGTVVASTNPQRTGANLASEEYFQKGKSGYSVTHFAKDQYGILSLYLTGPLVLDGKTEGVLVIQSDGKSITSVVLNYSGLGETGETLLVKKDDSGNAVFLSPIRFDSNATLTRRVSKSAVNVPSVWAIQGKEGILTNAVDYNGTPVLAVTRYIPSAQWGIVAKINKDEAYAPIRKLKQLFASIGTLSMLVIAGISIALAQALTSPIKRLTESAKRIGSGDFSHRTIIDSRDEIGALSIVFNEMVDKIQSAHLDLTEQVHDRTKNLTDKVNEMEETKKAMMQVMDALEAEKERFKNQVVETKKFAMAVDASSDHIVITDKNGIIIYANRAVEHLTGFSQQEVMGEKAGTTLLWGGKMTQGFYEKLWHTIQVEKKPFVGEIRNKRKDATEFISFATIYPITDEHGFVSFFVEILRDITKQKEVDRAKTEFVSLASHQLRTPLTTVRWAIESLLSPDHGSIHPKQQKYIRLIQDGNLRMIELVNALLNVSRIDLGTIAVKLEDCHIVDIIKQVLEELEPHIEKKSLHVATLITSDIDPFKADPKLLYIIVQNIIMNAISYTPESGHITIRVSQDEANILTSVEDTGYGIPEVDQPKIFSKLFRAENVQLQDTNGTGLGLYITKSIITESGGTIWFTSEEGKGTTFYFTLPLAGMKSRMGVKTLLS